MLNGVFGLWVVQEPRGNGLCRFHNVDSHFERRIDDEAGDIVGGRTGVNAVVFFSHIGQQEGARGGEDRAGFSYKIEG